MKKLFLLAACGLLYTGAANAQWATAQHRINNAQLPASKAINLNHKTARTTSTVIATETFNGGLPAGWSVQSSVNANWRWTSQASSSNYALDALQSTTASNGWMIYDSDSLSAALPNAVLDGYLTSGSYNCTGYNNVGVQFQEYYYRFQDSCYLDASNDGGTTWTSFPINANNTLASNGGTTNPYIATVNISAVAANQSNVKIRFHYMGRQGGAYSWLLDDVQLVDLDPVEVALEDGCVLMPAGDGGYISFGAMPAAFADTIYPISFVNNNGGAAQTNVSVNAAIFNGTSSVYNKSVVMANLGKNAWDSIADFTLQSGLVTNATGNYTVAFNVNQTGDVNTANNYDTATFALTDTVWTQESGNYVYAFWAHTPSTNPAGESSDFIGTRFTIPANKFDTLTTVSVGFYSATTVGSKVQIQIYHFNGTQWDPIGGTYTKTLTSADISPSGSIRFTTFQMDPATTNNGPLVIGDPGLTSTSNTYIAAVQLDGTPATSTVRIWGTQAPAYKIVNGSGVQSESQNDGTFSFGSNGATIYTLGNAAPAIRPNFGTYIPLSVNDVFASESNVNAFPNPANNNMTVSFTLKQAANVNVKIMNTLGQTVATQQVSKVAKGETRTAVFSTSALAQGVYFYTVEANGARVTKRFVVAH